MSAPAPVSRPVHAKIRRRAKVHHAVALPLFLLVPLVWLYIRFTISWSSDCRGPCLNASRASSLGLLVPIGFSVFLLVLIWRELLQEGRAINATPLPRWRHAVTGYRSMPRPIRRHVVVASGSGLVGILGLLLLVILLWVLLDFRAV
jgi:hypothetical protein